MHALDRINERYGNKFTMDDINILSTVIKKGLYLEIVKDFVDRDEIVVLLKYNKIPLKLVYSQKTKRVKVSLQSGHQWIQAKQTLYPQAKLA